MDSLITNDRLDSLRRCVERVRDRTPANIDTLLQDADAQDIVVLNLTRAVQLCVDLAMHMALRGGGSPPESMGAAFDALAEMGVIDSGLAERMRKSVGFRNVAVHNYRGIDWQIVHAVATRHLGDFEAFGSAIIAHEGLGSGRDAAPHP